MVSTLRNTEFRILTPKNPKLQTDDERRTTNDERQTTNDERRTTNNERRTTNEERRTTNDERRTTTTNDDVAALFVALLVIGCSMHMRCGAVVNRTHSWPCTFDTEKKTLAVVVACADGTVLVTQ